MPSDTAYFNAQYRQEYPAKPGDYLICDTEGRGQYVGTVLSAKCRTPGWFGEGDDRFYIDGDTEPTLRGTGTEDYFCDAWGFREFNRPYYGVVIFGGYEVGSLVSVYRWHVTDPIHFKKSLRFEIEHKGEMEDTNGKGTSSFAERPDLFSSVAFWYQTGQAKRFATLPPAQERVVSTVRVEFEELQKQSRVEPGNVAIGSQYNSLYSNNRSLSAPIEQPGQTMIVPFELADDNTGFVRLRLVEYLDYGSFEVSLDGKVIKGLEQVNLYNDTLGVQTFELGEMTLAKGKYELRFKAIGKSPMSTGYHIGIDSLQIEHFTAYFEPAE